MAAPLEVMGLIPARGGSKGIPRKNMHRVAGKPLIEYTFAAAQAAARLTRRVLSTDDHEIADYGRTRGIEVPFTRPASLASDSTPMIDVVLHALAWMDEHEGYVPDIVVLLQPTSPLRPSSLIDEAVDRLIQTQADSIVTVCEVPGHYHPDWQLTIDGGGFLQPWSSEGLSAIPSRRQALEPSYFRTGAVYATRGRVLREVKSLYGAKVSPLVMPVELSANVDSPHDLVIVECLLAKRART